MWSPELAPAGWLFFTNCGPAWVVTFAWRWGGVSSPILAPPWF